MSFTALGYVAQVILVALAFLGAIALAWVTRAAVRGWKRVPSKPRIRHGRMPLQPIEPIDLGQPEPEPESWRDVAARYARGEINLD